MTACARTAPDIDDIHSGTASAHRAGAASSSIGQRGRTAYSASSTGPPPAAGHRRRRSWPHCRCRTSAPGRRPGPPPSPAPAARLDAQAGIGAHPPGDNQGFQGLLAQRPATLDDQRGHHRLFESAGDVAAVLLAEFTRRGDRATVFRVWVFRPLKLKSSPGRLTMGRGKSKRRGSPCAAMRAICGSARIG